MNYLLGKPISLHLIGALLVAVFPVVHAAEDWTVPRTEFGQPDLQGVWYYGTGTDFERQEALGTQQSYTESEALAVAQSLQAIDTAKAQQLDPGRAAPTAGVPVAGNADLDFATTRVNMVRINGEYRTSQIVSPANGRWPYREGGLDFFEKLQVQGFGAFDGPEIRPASERCAGPTGGPAAPMVGWFYNANMQIIQSADYVILSAEMTHDVRIIPLDRAGSIPAHAQWMGYSTGYWEGNTLVVETKKFRPEQSWFFFRHSDQLEAIERFTLSSADEIHYSYTITDPEILNEPVTVEKNITRRAPGEYVYEYACHEGNYSLPGILAGARRLEREIQN